MYKTIRREAQAEIVIEKSRFIGHVFPITDEAQAQAQIEKIKKQHWQAAHNVPVYLLGERYSVQRYSDDGEPSGTAGLPVLEMLKQEGITDLCIVITRYFGGVKLGTGGLVRAYTESAKAVLAEAGLVTVDHYDHVVLSYDYTLQGKIVHLLSQSPVEGLNHNFTDSVETSFYILEGLSPALREKLVDLCHGKVQLNEPTIGYGCVDGNTFHTV